MTARVCRRVTALPADLEGTVAAIGVFDGVHRGHRALLDKVAASAAARGLPAAAVTFDRHPVALLRPEQAPRLLTTLRRRVALLGEAGMDLVLLLPFTRALSLLSPEQFVESVLAGGVRAREVLVGANFRFGHRAAGDVAALETLGRGFGIEVGTVGLAQADGEQISSTRIREALSAGDVATACRLLGRPHELEGFVVHGDARGAGLGIPTANVQVPSRMALPATGVYAGHLRVGAGLLPAVTNVGYRPQFDGRDLRIEAHVLDAELDLYGRRVGISFEHRLRPEARFESVEALVVQMRADVAAARELLAVARP